MAVVLESESYTTTFAYDALGRVVSRTTPDASETLPAYNEAGLLESVSVKLRGDSTPTNFVTNIDYNARGQRTKIEYGNGTVTEYEYDAATFRLARLVTTRTSPAAPLQDLTYTYDPVGNITTIADAVQKTTYFDNTVVPANRTFEYDPLYRLINATGREHPGQQPNDVEYPRANDIPHANDPALRAYKEYYAYDQVGNILEMRHANGSDVWKRRYQIAEDSNRLLATSLPGDDENEYSAAYSHDAHGNMTTMPHLGVMAWDPFDRLAKTSVASSGQPVTYYAYDASGQRTRKVTENENGIRTKERIYVGGFEIYREYVAGDLDLERESLHIMDDAARIALVETKTIDGGDPVTTPTPLQRYQLSNHLGSACVEVDDAGAVISFEEYYPFGGTAFHSATTAIPKRYRYTGKERDDETGLYYYSARYYAPWLGRWTAADPSGLEDGPNVYAYVRNNPVMMVDPSGTEEEPPLGSIAPNGAYAPLSVHFDPGYSRENIDPGPTLGPIAGAGPGEGAVDQSVGGGAQVAASAGGGHSGGKAHAAASRTANASAAQAAAFQMPAGAQLNSVGTGYWRRQGDDVEQWDLEGGNYQKFSDAPVTASAVQPDDIVLGLGGVAKGLFLAAGTKVIAAAAKYSAGEVGAVTTRKVATEVAEIATENMAKGAGEKAAGALVVGAAKDVAKEASAYSVVFETVIPKAGTGTRGAHFKAANEVLAKEMRSNPEFGAAIESLGIKVPTGGTGSALPISPRGWTWHHVPDQPGMLQLVPTGQHQGGMWQRLLHPGGIGGFKIWGSDF